MEVPKASYSSSMGKHVSGITSSRDHPGLHRKSYPPFQAIIEKGKQAKAQDEQDQYEARKAKREADIKNAARIRHAQVEANRRCEEESNQSIDDHKGRLLGEMTKNIKAILENQYRGEIREKVYEDEDKIASAYEHDIKDQTRARLVRELEPLVKAKLGAEFESEVKQQLASELESVVKAELRAKYEPEVMQHLIKELGPGVEAGLCAKYETEVKQKLAEELQSGVKAELRAKYEEEIKNTLTIGPEPAIVHKLKGAHTNEAENEPQGQLDALHTPNAESFRATPNEIDDEGGEYPDLSHHQHLIDQNGIQSGRQEAVSAHNSLDSDTDEVAFNLPRGTKRSLNGEEDEEEVRQSKRSRSASFSSEGQHSPSSYEKEVSELYSTYPQIQQPYQGVRYTDENPQALPEYRGDVGYEESQDNHGDEMDRGAAGYASSDEIYGGHGNIMDHRGAHYNGASDGQGMNGDFLDREGADYDSAEDVQGTLGNSLDREEANYDSAEDTQGTNGNFLDREGAYYDITEGIQGNSGYVMDDDATESYSSEEDEDEDEEDDEEYESEEGEQYSTDAQAAPSIAENGVITISNTQDTAFVLSDSEEDEDEADDENKTLVGYEGPTTLKDPEHYNAPAEESLFLNT